LAGFYTEEALFYQFYPWIEAFKARNNIKLIELTQENRDIIPLEIHKYFTDGEVYHGRD
jgi:nucleoside-triphosphatase THEP1